MLQMTIRQTISFQQLSLAKFIAGMYKLIACDFLIPEGETQLRLGYLLAPLCQRLIDFDDALVDAFHAGSNADRGRNRKILWLPRRMRRRC
jgi:hypothetical protein